MADVFSECSEFVDSVEKLRKDEFKRLKDTVYLDHAGTTLYSESQLAAVFKDLNSHLYGNPHSRNESSQLSTDLIDQVRHRVVQSFNTSLDQYSVVFTSGATGAIKLLAESFEWGDEGKFLHLEDNHTSVLGVRAVAKRFGAVTECISAEQVSQSCTRRLKSEAVGNLRGFESRDQNGLFAYPSQSNFCGRKYPLWWTSAIHNGALDVEGENEPNRKNWLVLLDAAGSVGTSPVDLGHHQPDFVCFSFHKIFGYPTGLGCLLVRRTAEWSLSPKERYFGGGTVLVASAKTDFHRPRTSLEERLEAGTVSFLDILAVKHGYDTLQMVTGMKSIKSSMFAIGDYTFHLAQYVHHRMRDYRHSNGQPTVVLYCQDHFVDVTTQGAVVNFNLLQSDGQFIGFAKVETMAAAYNIHLRTGCMCNPGACQKYLGLSFEDLQHHFEAGHVCGDEKDLIDGQPTGSIRISFGYMSTMDDARRFLQMIEACFVDGGKDHSICYSPTCRKPLWKSPDVDIEIDEGRKAHLPNLRNGHDNGGLQLQDVASETIGHQPFQPTSNSMERRDLGCRQENKLRDLFCNCFSNRQWSQSCCGSHITTITLYPIKSCGGFQVNSWKVGSRGFLYDRNWMIVSNGGASLTQKREPKMCFIKPEIDLQKQILRVHCRGLPSIELPINMTRSDLHHTNVSLCQTKICGDRVEVIDCGDEVASWLRKALQREDDCRLLQQCCYSDRRSRIKKNRAKNSAGVINKTDSIRSSLSLVNEAQFLMLNRESAKFLARQMALEDEDEDEDVIVDQLLARFRGNLIVNGMPAFVEEQWTEINVADSRYRVEGLCSRCQMICIDQETGEKSKEPLTTLATIRENKVQFGVYLNVITSEDIMEGNGVIIKVGDPVIVRSLIKVDPI